jgi:predicted RND superfamily exporter protein
MVLNQLLTKDVFDALWVLDSKVRSIELPSNGRKFSEICTLVGGKCSVFSPLLFWSDQASYESTVSSDTDVIAATSASTFANGFPVSRLALFGKFEEDTTTGALTEAYGTSISYQLDSTKVSPTEAQEFEDIFLASLGLRNAPSDPVMYQTFDALYIQVYGDRSLDAELARVITIDMPLVVVEYVVMFAFIVCALSWGEKSTKAGLAAGAVMSCVASIMAAYGIIAACGVPITSLIFILPFILVGIGVDDAFVIVATYRQVELSESEVAAAVSNGSDEVSKLIKIRCSSLQFTLLISSYEFTIYPITINTGGRQVNEGTRAMWA